MKRVIKVKYVDLPRGVKAENEYSYELLSRDYAVRLCDDPDYLFCFPFGSEHLKYDCVKILLIGENTIPDFNLYDYAIGFDHLSLDDRFLRVPLFAYYPAYRDPELYKWEPSDEELLNRGFCSFVVSNSRGDPLREQFFRELSKYKKVDSGGRYLNNVGGPVPDKVEFCRKYKFNIAFENSVSPGYTTEKVMEPLVGHSVPIYYGNPTIEEDVSPDCLVRVASANDVQRAIEEIVYLDQHDEAYLAKCRAKTFVHSDPSFYDQQMLRFFHQIMDQPVERAKRLIPYGWQMVYRNHLMEVSKYEPMIARIRRMKSLMKRVLKSGWLT